MFPMLGTLIARLSDLCHPVDLHGVSTRFLPDVAEKSTDYRSVHE